MKEIDFRNYNVKFLKELAQRPSHCKQRKPWIGSNHKIPEDQIDANYCINASQCELTNLVGIGFLAQKALYHPNRLIKLDVSGNKINSLEGVIEAPNLYILILDRNLFTEYSQLDPLKQATSVRELSLVSNLLTTKQDYRKEIRKRFTHIVVLDGKNI